MESVLQKIKDARVAEIKKRLEKQTRNAVINGCQVSLHFNSVGDKKALTVVKSMLISSHLDAALTTQPGGEKV